MTPEIEKDSDQPAIPRWLRQVVSRIRQWWSHRQIMKACDESSKRMSKMTREERRALSERALATIYPDGHWNCENHGELISYRVENGQKCPVCNSANAEVSDGGPLTLELKQDANPPFAAPLG